MFIFQCAPATSAIQIRGADNSAEYLPKMSEKESCLENRDSSLFMAEITRTKLRIQFTERIMSATIIKLAKNEKIADFIIKRQWDSPAAFLIIVVRKQRILICGKIAMVLKTQGGCTDEDPEFRLTEY